MEEKLTQRPASCIRIVLFGPESTGKTTLSEDLARHYDEPLVKEYMREYLQEVWDAEKRSCEPKDLIPIAQGQIQAENRLSATAKKLLICDTNLLELKVYSEAYYDGYCNPLLLKHALNHYYDLYILTYIDVPWTPDDLRDKPHDREGMFHRFQDTLDRYQKPYFISKGNRKERLEYAVKKIDQLIKNRNREF
ncbi:AAA family ATPase [Christiangramia sabulilitoris]|uniref:ATP-binding protein n=1 Tax=Christiangramia sabulilitoris TaxID=2583991 RepID=A0A550I872_9FLAO|nr:ATP-binding protein [Christiangramia sabulilitoris]TRO67177.1 ATP-binding protein [Christiangramia sabulilitoris]